jgi:hypothetical protein
LIFIPPGKAEAEKGFVCDLKINLAVYVMIKWGFSRDYFQKLPEMNPPQFSTKKKPNFIS